jgi:hypothetical protein
MAGTISDLTAITGANLDSTDELEVVDVSDTTMAATGTNKSTTLADLAAASAFTAKYAPLYGRVSSNITALVNNSTTLADVTDLSVSVAANVTYELRGLLLYSAATTADLKIGFSTPAGVTGQWTALGMQNGATANTNTTARWQSQNDYTETNQLGAVGVGITSTSTRCTALISGIVIVSSTAGTFQLRAAQQVADSSDLAIGVGSFITLTRVV